jgi:hypothetical protein
MSSSLTQRGFLNTTALCVASAATAMNASSYARIKGAQDKVHIGLLSCGSRSGVFREGKKMYWDREKEEIVDHPLYQTIGGR